MNRVSVLWPNGMRAEPSPEPPSHLRDLNLDYVIDAIASRRPEYDVKRLLWRPLRDLEAVHFRQQVFQDLERPEVREAVDAFTQAMQTTRRYLRQADRSYSPHFRQGWHLEAARVYCDAVTALAQRLAVAPLQSSALQAFRAELQAYVASQPFQTLAAEARSVKQALENITFCVILEYGKFRVKPYEEEKDYTSEIESVFAKFKRPGKAEDYITNPVQVSGMSHIEAIMVDFVAKMFPEPFAQLAEFCHNHEHFIDEGVAQFEREVQFYLAYLDFIDELRRAGQPFCYPEVSATSKETLVVDGFDIALAHMLSQQGRKVVRNGFTLSGPERILVVTGPNQGGKTTFARMVGQIHYLAGLGGPVPGRRARLFLPDRIFTLFPREEDVTTLRSRLEEELFRLRDILHQELTHLGMPVAFPDLRPAPEFAFTARGLYDPSLALAQQRAVVPNDVNGDGKVLVLITGPNRGGKTTFLRSVGLAHLMMQSGMFVAAHALQASIVHGVFTHFPREEDETLQRGKLEEELQRMSGLVPQLQPHNLLLCNESFASTNEREGSEIARQIVSALVEKGIRVFYVTHLFAFTGQVHAQLGDRVLSLRAERLPDGTRTFRLQVAAPKPTAHGMDLYRQIFHRAAAEEAPQPA